MYYYCVFLLYQNFPIPKSIRFLQVYTQFQYTAFQMIHWWQTWIVVSFGFGTFGDYIVFPTPVMKHNNIIIIISEWCNWYPKYNIYTTLKVFLTISYLIYCIIIVYTYSKACVEKVGDAISGFPAEWRGGFRNHLNESVIDFG